MVIHDMRNPTTSIQFGVTEVLAILKKYFNSLQQMTKDYGNDG